MEHRNHRYQDTLLEVNDLEVTDTIIYFMKELIDDLQLILMNEGLADVQEEIFKSRY